MSIPPPKLPKYIRTYQITIGVLVILVWLLILVIGGLAVSDSTSLRNTLHF